MPPRGTELACAVRSSARPYARRVTCRYPGTQSPYQRPTHYPVPTWRMLLPCCYLPTPRERMLLPGSAMPYAPLYSQTLHHL
eukprot:2751326-Rhodomonas_salina.1